jgi:signal transduction histidine kinase
MRSRLQRIVAGVPVLAQDAVFAAVLCVLDIRTQWTSQNTVRWIGDGPLPWPAVAAYGAAGYAVLVWRRRNPQLVFALLCTHSIVAQLLLPYRPFLGLLVAFYTVAARVSLPRALVAMLATTIASALTVADEVRDASAGDRGETLVVDVLLFGVLQLTILLVARRIRRHRHDLDDLEARRGTAVLDERARIARELHDIVAHSVTVMVLQAAGSRRVLGDAEPRVGKALTDIERTGHQAMEELRRLLGVLAASDAPVAPHPGLDDIGAAVDRVRAAGLSVVVRHEGEPRPLDPSVGLAAHHVVAEGLTNALKHVGAGASADVLLHWRDDRFAVSVTDDGRGDRAVDARLLSTGRGLVGLGERVRAVGGTLTADRLPDNGFRLRATLPVAALDRRAIRVGEWG